MHVWWLRRPSHGARAPRLARSTPDSTGRRTRASCPRCCAPPPPPPTLGPLRAMRPCRAPAPRPGRHLTRSLWDKGHEWGGVGGGACAGCVAASCERVRRRRGKLRVGDDGEAGGGITGAVSFCAAWTHGDRRGRQTEGATGAGLQGWADGRTKTNVAPKNVHALFFLVVGDSKLAENYFLVLAVGVVPVIDYLEA